MRKIIGGVAILVALLAPPASAMVDGAADLGTPPLPDRLGPPAPHGLRLGPPALEASRVDAGGSESGAIVPDRYIVVLRDSVAGTAAVARAQVRERNGRLGLVYRHALKGYSAVLSRDDVAALERDPRVKYVTPDRIVSVAAQKTPTGIGRSYAATNPSLAIDEAENVKVFADVAVIDTGVDHTHPDLNVIERANCVPAGEDPEDPEEEPIEECTEDSGNDGSGHGTHVAGTIGALDNGTGVVGVAPATRIWAVKALNDKGAGSMSWIVAGVDWVTAHAEQIEVANMSLGCACESPALDEAIDASIEAGVVYVVAAGNDEVDSKYFTPASHPAAITVSALADYDGEPGGNAHSTCGYGGLDDRLATFSNYGSGVDVAAPGVCIRSTLPDGKDGYSSGTSMASPHVAGAAAVLASVENPEDQADVEAIAVAIEGEGSSAWTDTSPDGVKEPLLDLSDHEIFNANDAVTVTLPPVVESPAKATLRGSVHSAGWSSFRYYFEYGKTAGYGTTVPVPPGDLVESAADFTKVSKAIEGLQGSTVYHYRVVAVHNGYYFQGPDRTFATTPPVATTEEATDVHANDATLNATVDPEGLETTYYFELSLNQSNVVRLPADTASAGSGTQSVVVSQPVETLTGNKTYGYRIVASNAAGKAYGEEVEFTTKPSQWTTHASLPPGGPDDSFLGYLSCVSSHACTAVGKEGSQMIATRWDGDNWQKTQLPRQKGADQSFLEGISCVTASWCMAVGIDVVEEPFEWRLLTEVWDGSQWKVTAVSAPEEALFPALRDVSCIGPDHCVAVGHYWLANGEGRALAYRWDGQQWSSLPALKTAEPELSSVSCTSSSWCMATGHHWLPDDSIGPLAETWNGESWIPVQTSPPQGAAFSHLGQLDCASPNSCMVLGYSAAGEGNAMSEHWDGLKWTPEAFPTPATATSAAVTGISCPEEEACFAVGDFHSGSLNRYMPQALGWDGDSWVFQSAADQSQESEPLGLGAALYSVDCTSQSHCLAVGESGGGPVPRSALVERYQAPGPVLETEPARDVTRFGAELRATINPAGVATNYQFEYGTSTAYGSKAPASPATAGEGSEDVAVGQWIEGLKPDTTYHFRVRATNASGTSYGTDRTFTTKAAAQPIFSFAVGKAGSGAGELDEPLGLDVDGEGNVWVADTENDRVEKFDSTGKFLLASGSLGTSNGKFDTPHDVAVDAAGNVWVTDTHNNRAQKLDPQGKYLAQLGGKGSGAGQLFLPWGIDIDSEGKIWIVDRGNERLQRFNANGQYLSQFPTYGAAIGVAADGDGNLWVSEPADNRVRKFSADGKALVTIGSGQSGHFALPQGLAVDAEDNVWVADTSNHRVRAFEADGRSLTEFGSGGSGPGQLSYPGDLAFEPGGDVWALDSGNSRLQKWSFGAPDAITEEATDVTSTAMTLNAAVNPEGSQTSYRFEYGKTVAYGSSVPISPESIGSGDKDVAVSKRIEGLKPSTSYHFRVVATNQIGTVYGEDRTVTTEHAWEALPPPSFEHHESKLSGVSCVSANDCVAVGHYRSTDTTKKRNLAARWDGEKWSLLTTPNKTSEDSVLSAVSCTSSTSCVAVGRYVLSASLGAYRLQAAHWNGSEWAVKDLPIMSIYDNELNAVSCKASTNCIAVGRGKKTSSGANRTLALRWNGEAWSIVATPNEGEKENVLSGVSCNSATACIAVGYYKSAGTAKKRNLAARWDGEKWSLLTTPNKTSEDSVLSAVSCTSSTSCVAVGRYVLSASLGAYRLQAAHWNGSEWTSQDLPVVSIFDNELNGISCETNGICTAVGRGKKSSSGANRTLALHRHPEGELEETPETWLIEPTPNEGEASNALSGVSCVSGSCVAVGSYLNSSGVTKMLMERY